MKPVTNPPNPWARYEMEWLGPPPAARLEIYEERAGSIVTENTSPDVDFRFGVNPYRGCFHGCSYCYARPTHQYLDFGAGTDFERRIVVKVNAPELLERKFRSRSWSGDRIAFSGNTDAFQPLEAHYELTRRMLEICLRYRNPVGVITKSALVRRDAELLGRLAREADARVFVSIPFVDASMARAVEPYAPSPKARFDAIAVLAAAGVRVGVALAPIIPGLNDDQAVPILERAAAAGATRHFTILLRLPRETGPVFWQRLEQTHPDRVDRVRNALEQCGAGETAFHERMRGRGPRWDAIRSLIQVQARRLGFEEYNEASPAPSPDTFRKPRSQLELFDP